MNGYDATIRACELKTFTVSSTVYNITKKLDSNTVIANGKKVRFSRVASSKDVSMANMGYILHWSFGGLGMNQPGPLSYISYYYMQTLNADPDLSLYPFCINMSEWVSANEDDSDQPVSIQLAKLKSDKVDIVLSSKNYEFDSGVLANTVAYDVNDYGDIMKNEYFCPWVIGWVNYQRLSTFTMLAVDMLRSDLFTSSSEQAYKNKVELGNIGIFRGCPIKAYLVNVPPKIDMKTLQGFLVIKTADVP